MEEKVVNFSKIEDKELREVEDCFKNALEECRAGKVRKVIIITLDNNKDSYTHGHHSAGLRHSESIALLEITKTVLLRNMGII